jgi:hypothetical protein
MSLEERKLQQLMTLWADDRPAPSLLAFNRPDIICGLPEDAVRRVVKVHSRRNFRGWETLLNDYGNAAEPQSFKRYFERRMRMPVSALIENVLVEVPRGARGTPELTRTLKPVLG